jgi:hypothetical protein
MDRGSAFAVPSMARGLAPPGLIIITPPPPAITAGPDHHPMMA